MTQLDPAWLRDHPLPKIPAETDKNERGRVLVVGGCRTVPGALRLTGEAALRAGAGKLQLATIEEAALALGLAVPEAAVIGLVATADGEIDAAGAAHPLRERAERSDALVLGPGMSGTDGDAALVETLAAALPKDAGMVLDAAALRACRHCADTAATLGGRAVLTPHAGEMAALTGQDAEWIEANPDAVAQEVADRLNAVVVMKGGTTVIAAPNDSPVVYAGGGPGLATGGSGDVLAGILGGLLARGAEPRIAAAWAVWLHGEAGRLVTHRLGGPGLLARELLPFIPELLHAPATRG